MIAMVIMRRTVDASQPRVCMHEYLRPNCRAPRRQVSGVKAPQKSCGALCGSRADLSNAHSAGMSGDDGIDPANKELYLTDDEFLSSFELSKDAYKASRGLVTCLLFCSSGFCLMASRRHSHNAEPATADDLIVRHAGKAQVAPGAAEEEERPVLRLAPGRCVFFPH